MKVIVIGDIHVDTDYFAEQINTLPWQLPLLICKYKWFPRNKKTFQKTVQKIEADGPEGIDIPKGLLEDCADADAIFTHFCPINREMIESAKNLKLIGTCRGGLEHISPAAEEKKIPIFSVVRNAEPVADFTVGLLYAESRNIARAHHELVKGNWEKHYPNYAFSTSVRDLIVGVIGFGSIGRLAAEKLTALGVKVLVHDPFYTDEQLKKQNHHIQPCTMTELLKQSDVISLHVRSEQGAPPIMNRKEFELMKKNSFLINTSRAYAVDEQSLLHALTTKKISGAALDVFWEEPIPKGHPLLSMKNVTVTPHIAGDTPQAIPKSPKLLVEKLTEEIEKQTLSIFKKGR